MTIQKLADTMNAETSGTPGREMTTQRLRSILHDVAHGNAPELQARERAGLLALAGGQ